MIKITDKVHLLEGAKGSYCFLVFADELTLIDTGLAPMRKRILGELEQSGIAPADIRRILLTHHDTDHVGNLAAMQQLSGAQVRAHENDIPFISGEKERSGFKKYIAKLARLKPVTDILPYDQTMMVGDIRILPTPGHTPGHVCMLFDGVLFAGDLVECKKDRVAPYPSGWNWNTPMLLESVASLKNIDYDWLCAAHGKPCRRKI